MSQREKTAARVRKTLAELTAQIDDCLSDYPGIRSWEEAEETATQLIRDLHVVQTALCVERVMKAPAVDIPPATV